MLCPEPGIYHNVSMQTYLAWGAINWHTLAGYRRSALEGKHLSSLPQLDTTPKVEGAAFHDAVRMTEEEFRRTWVVMPHFEGHRNSKLYQDAASKWRAENQDKPMLEEWELAALLRQQRAVNAHPVAREIVQARGRNEISIVWRDKETGELCKGRIDKLCRLPAGLIDLADPNPKAMKLVMPDFKTCASTHFGDVNRQRAKYAYHGQLAWYLRGFKTLEPAADPIPCWVWVEAPPKTGDSKGVCAFDVIVMDARNVIDEGWDLCKKMLRRLVDSRKAGRWPGIANVVVPASLTYGEGKSAYEVIGDEEDS